MVQVGPLRKRLGPGIWTPEQHCRYESGSVYHSPGGFGSGIIIQESDPDQFRIQPFSKAAKFRQL
jgi:hypothetical protein